MDRLEDEAQKLESRVSERSAAFRAVSQPVSIEAVQAKIPEGAALVEIIFYRPVDLHSKSTEQFGALRV